MITAQLRTPPHSAPSPSAPSPHILFLIWYVLAILLFVTTLTHYAFMYHHSFTFGDVLASPASYAGMNLSLTGPYASPAEKSTKESVADAGTVAASSFYVIYNKKLVRIDYNDYGQTYAPPRWGEVSLYGQVQTDGSIQAWQIHNYDYNYLLYVLSFLTGIGVLLFFGHEWNITWRGFTLRQQEGKHA